MTWITVSGTFTKMEDQDEKKGEKKRLVMKNNCDNDWPQLHYANEN